MTKRMLMLCLCMLAGLLAVQAKERKTKIVKRTWVSNNKDTTKQDTYAADETVEMKIYGDEKEFIFNKGTVPGFTVKLRNGLSSEQEGRLWYTLQDDYGQFVREDSIPVKMKSHSGFTGHFSIPSLHPGFYNIYFKLNLSEYDDTVHRMFGVQTQLLKADTTKPADFYSFWKETKAQLAAIAPRYRVTEDDSLEAKHKYHKIYAVEMKSFGNVTIHGWLTVPRIGKNYPVMIKLPGYMTELLPFTDENYAIFSLNLRGNYQRADSVKYTIPEYNLTGLDSKEQYIYRAIYMDCIRGVDFIMSEGEKYRLNPEKLMADGGSQGGCLVIALAGLDSRIKLATLQLPIYANFNEAMKIVITHPYSMGALAYFYEYKRLHPGYDLSRVNKLWRYFDPVKFAPQIHCPVMIGVGLLDLMAPPACSYALFNSLASTEKEIHSIPEKSHEVTNDYLEYQRLWAMEKL